MKFLSRFKVHILETEKEAKNTVKYGTKGNGLKEQKEPEIRDPKHEDQLTMTLRKAGNKEKMLRNAEE